MAAETQSTAVLSREQICHLFDRFTFLTSQTDVKKRIADTVRDNQEAVAVTTAIQEEIFLEMGVDPRFGISSLGKISTEYENDQDLVIQFYKFLAKEEMACDEAELGEEEFAEKIHSQQELQEQQLEMLKHMRKFHLDDQSAILEKLHQQMENGNYESETSILSAEQLEEIIQRKVSPLFMPSTVVSFVDFAVLVKSIYNGEPTKDECSRVESFTSNSHWSCSKRTCDTMLPEF